MMAKDVDFILKAAKAIESDPKKSWFSKLPPEAQKRLAEVKKAFEDGRFAGISLSAVCQATAALLKEHKWPVPKSRHTISRWLRSSDI